MFDSMLSLAFSLASSPGVNALLLGSGVSRAAQIPTGWEIILDLTRQVAVLEGADAADPAEWYRTRFNAEPDYSQLLARVAPTPAERQQLLKRYFEPSESERAAGKKTPTAAHHAIAQLVARGSIRILLTTNFDRLLEQALEAAGVMPTVISSADAAAGALPLQHSRCTVVKLHGDYLDPRIRNTDEELASYDEVANRLLDRVLDEYGLVVCGWSGDWDIALREAIKRCPSRRFSTYWMSRGAPTERATRLIAHRQGKLISIDSADQAFTSLADKVQALIEHNNAHPLSAPLAVATLKQYLPEDRYSILLHDLVLDEATRLRESLADERFPAQDPDGGTQPHEFVLNRIKTYEALTEILAALFVTGCYWGESRHEYLWIKSLRLVFPSPRGSGLVHLLNLRNYPTLFLLYAGGMAALASGRHSTLKALLTVSSVLPNGGTAWPIFMELHPENVLAHAIAASLPGLERHHTPISDRLYDALRGHFRTLIPDDAEYQHHFDRWEYLLSLAFAHVYDRRYSILGLWPGRFLWNRRYSTTGIADVFQREISEQSTSWPFLQVGLFEGSLERLNFIKAQVDKTITNRTLSW